MLTWMKLVGYAKMRIWFFLFVWSVMYCYHLFSDILFAVKYNINKLPFSQPSSSSFFHTFSQLHPSILHPPVLSGMASMTASAATAVVARASLVPKTAGFSSAPVLGLPQMRMKGGRVTCSSEKTTAAPVGMGAASMLAAVSVMSVSNPVLALVDERMSTEGTGLSLGLSNNLLGWILLGVFGLIWSLYTVYTSTLEEDEESGLSL